MLIPEILVIATIDPDHARGPHSMVALRLHMRGVVQPVPLGR
jgi:hypothetical protein